MKDLSFNIFHTSDLHFGEKSIANDSIFPEAFESFFSLLMEVIEEVIISFQIKIFIISGDFISKGDTDQFEDEKLIQILELFKKYDIPICIANGNHDLVLDSIENNTQFQDFTQFIYNNKNTLGSKVSNDFKSNQASYVYLEEYNTIFIALNSCKYIQKKKIIEDIKNEKIEGIKYDLIKEFFENRKISNLNSNFSSIILEIGEKYEKNMKKLLTDYLKKQYIDIGILSRSDLANIFRELKEEFSQVKFEYMNKIIICHHPLSLLKKHKMSLNFLKDNNIEIIFSGHTHDYYYDPLPSIKNFGAGSILANLESRYNKFDLGENPPQFNIYNINIPNQKIEITKFYYSKDRKWEADSKENPKDINFKYGTNLDNWISINQIDNKIGRELKKKNINNVFCNEKKFEPNITFFCKDQSIIQGFLIKDTDSPLYVDRIKEWLINHNETHIEKIKDNFLIIKNTDKFNIQLPLEYVISK